MFCATCKTLLVPRLVRGRPVARCPHCDEQKKLKSALDRLDEDAPDRASQAAKVASGARPHVPASTRVGGGGGRGRRTVQVEAEEGARRAPKELPAPDRLALPPGADLFPFGKVRDGQREFLADVGEAVRAGKHLLAHAPTGLGKTVSTLVPLVQYAVEHQKRVFFLTSKQSQHKIAIDTLQAVRAKSGIPFVVSDVIAKQDMCPRREARDLFSAKFAKFCRDEQRTHQCEYWERGNAGAVKLLKERVHHVEQLVIAATDCGVCPHQAALDLAAQAHVVVCDYNYFFSDLRESMQERLRVDLADVILVVDEAHNLPDRVRDHLERKLNEYVLDDALDEANRLGDTKLGNLIEALSPILETLAAKEVPRVPGEIDRSERYVTRDELVDAVDEAFAKRIQRLTASSYDKLVDELGDAVAEYEKRTKDDSEGLANLLDFLTNWRIERRGLARILTTAPAPSLSYKILDPAFLAKPVFDAVHASVVMSGTLHPMEMMRDVLGLSPERAVLREYESPFPRDNRLVLVDAAVTTGYKERTPQMFRDIGARLAEVALATPGNVAAFFPSYAILEAVRPHVEAGLGRRKQLVVEQRGLDKGEKEALIGRLRTGIDNALLLGVMAGSLSEGYDYADNLLKGVVIVGLPFAAPSLEVEALISYYDKKFGPGLGRPYAYVHPTFHKVLQAAGRCIRGPEDRGVIVLMDKRFGWGSYRASYPRDFRPRESADVPAEVRRFWAR